MFLIFLEENYMRKVFGLIFCSMVMLFTTGCTAGSIDALLTATGVDLSGVDVNGLMTQLEELMSSSGV
jgi:hypothetical protein